MMKRYGGFTVIELLVAVVTMVILTAVLAGVVVATLGVWNQGRNWLDTCSNARQIMQRLGDELKGARASPNVSGSQIQFVENVTTFPTPDPAPIPSPIPLIAENIFFVAPQPNLGAGDLCVIAYALDWRTHELKRAFSSSDTAWSISNRYQADKYPFVAADWHTIATGVLEFEIRSYAQANLDPSPAPTPTLAPSWDSELSSPTWMTGVAPRRIVLRLKLVDAKTDAQLARIPPGATYDSIVARAGRDFFYEVSLPPP
ncbi:MAG: PulJ/GspJ family protein [Chthoniobacterales bacterium]